MKEYSLLEVIYKLKYDPKVRFVRVNDKNFEVYKGHYGDLMMKVGIYAKPLPIFNYIQDVFVIKER